jgi:hypothetical protein
MTRNNRDETVAAPLPFTTFGEILAHGLAVHVWCAQCKNWGRANLSGRDAQRFAGARFRCGCGGFGHPSIRPATPTQATAGDTITDLYCGRCVPPWEMRDVRLDRPPWSGVAAGGGRFLCPGCRRQVLMSQRTVEAGRPVTAMWPHLRPGCDTPR